LFVSGEYWTGMIRSPPVAVPRRVPVPLTKLAVFVLAVLPTMTLMSLVAFLSGEAIIAQVRFGYSLRDPVALRVTLGTAVYLTLMGVLGAMLGWIVRSKAGALVTNLAVVLVIPVIFANVLGSWGAHVAEYLPSQAGSAFVTVLPDGLSLSPWTGLGVMALWVLGFIAVALVVLRRRDA
jgi:hypothetical protein